MMIAMKAYQWWLLHGNLIDFLPMYPCTFFKGEYWHCWNFQDASSFKIMNDIPYVMDSLNCDSDWTRLGL